jgi:hypothetical protein
MPELRIKEVRLPELRLPEMSRHDISRVIDDARDQISDIELPDLTKVDLSKVEMPRIDLSRIDLPKAVAAAPFIRRRGPRRWPFVLGALVAITAVVAVILNQPAVRARLDEMVRTARMRYDERRSEMAAHREGARAFDAAVAVPVQPSAYADDAPIAGSPFDGSDGLPEGLGAEQTAMPPAEDATRV